MDRRVTKAVEFLLLNPNASILQPMAAIQLFSPLEISNQSIQQQVRRAHKKKKLLVPSSVSESTNSTLSPWTNPAVASSSTKNKENDSTNNAEALEALMQLSSASSATSAQESKKRKQRNTSVSGVKEIWLTSSQAQQKQINDKRMKTNHKLAFKEACLLYKVVQEKEK